MTYEHRFRTKNKWLPWLNEAERVLLEEGGEMRASQIYERTKDKLYWTKVPKSSNAAAQIMRFDRKKRFYKTEGRYGGYHQYGLREWAA
jgi:hypothetical protein